MAKNGKHYQIKNHHLKKYNVGICFGTYRILHSGHIRLFRQAKKICKKLYAITETDELINKDIISTCEERVQDLRGIKYLNGVFVRSKKYDRKYWCDYLKADVLILGDDWEHKEWEGKKLRVPIVYFKYTKGISSTLCHTSI